MSCGTYTEFTVFTAVNGRPNLELEYAAGSTLKLSIDGKESHVKVNDLIRVLRAIRQLDEVTSNAEQA